MIAVVIVAGIAMVAFICRAHRVVPTLCRFAGCDDDATVANARGALCALHADMIEHLCTGGGWDGVERRDERRVIRAGDLARMRRFSDVYQGEPW